MLVTTSASSDFAWNTELLGMVYSSCSWSYCVMQKDICVPPTTKLYPTNWVLMLLLSVPSSKTSIFSYSHTTIPFSFPRHCSKTWKGKTKLAEQGLLLANVEEDPENSSPLHPQSHPLQAQSHILHPLHLQTQTRTMHPQTSTPSSVNPTKSASAWSSTSASLNFLSAMHSSSSTVNAGKQSMPTIVIP